MECENVVHVMVVGEGNDVIPYSWLEVITTGWCHSHGILKVCAELGETRNVEGNDLLKEGGSKITVPGVKEDLDPEVEVLLQEIKFMPPVWFPRRVYQPVVQECLTQLLWVDMDE